MKLYKIIWTSQDEQEMIAAPSLIAAIKFYCNFSDFPLDEFNDDDEIIEIPESEWPSIVIKNTEYDATDPDDKESWTITELVKEPNWPHYVCGTMYD